MKRRIVISPHAPGLGDALLYSTLPQRFAESNVDCFLSASYKMRNIEAYDLIWNQNPYLSGVSDNPVCYPKGNRDLDHAKYVSLVHHGHDPISAIELMYGFGRRAGELRPPAPFVDFVPMAIYDWGQSYRNAIVFDPNSISQGFSIDAKRDFLYQMLRIHGAHSPRIAVFSKFHPYLEHEHSFLKSEFGFQIHTVTDLHEYVTIMQRCAVFLCVESGGAVLAAALRQEVIARPTYVLFTSQSLNDRLFVFPQNIYKVTSRMTPDYVTR